MPPKATNSSVCSASPASVGRAGRRVLGHDGVRQDAGGAACCRCPRSRRSRRAVEEAVDLALRVVEAARARPAVRAAIDGLVPVGRRRPAGARPQSAIPRLRSSRRLDEGVAAALVRRARSALEPAPAESRDGRCGCGDARPTRGCARIGDGAGSAGDGTNVDAAVRTPAREEAAPVGGVGSGSPRHGAHTRWATRSQFAPRIPTIAASG